MSPKVLLLGMVCSEEKKINRGQRYRDAVRADSLQKTYDVYSLDDKHSVEDARLGKHCQANFCDVRRMSNCVEQVWGKKIAFKTVYLDYFFSPNSWAAVRWPTKFFTQSLPKWAEKKFVTDDVWLPHVSHVHEMMDQHFELLDSYYEISYESNPDANELYSATSNVTDLLEKCPDTITNATQLPHLLNFSDAPFVHLQVRKERKSIAIGKRKRA